MMGSSTIARAALLVLAGAALGLVANAARPGGVSIARFTPPTQCSGAEGHPGNDDVSPAEASAWCGRNDVVIADARSAAAYAEGHVAGAIHLPCDANGQAAVEALAHFDRAQRIVVYGQGTDDARPVADSLKRRHPAVRVQVLAGGFAAWSGAGLACASGPCAECATSQASATGPR
jgi:rhodanese-related sulfurtransferase